MIVLEVAFLALFWTWVFSAALFLRNTVLPRLPMTASPEAWHLPATPVRFQAADGVWLSGWTIAADPREPWLILCHGLGANRADLLDIAAGLFKARYNLLLFDFRAHGDSEGRSTSFGWHEQRDLEGALAFLGAQPEIPDRPYGVFGVSMGGAVAVMVAAEDERIGAVAIDSMYSDLEASINHHIKLLYRLPRIPFGWFVASAYRLRFGVWPRQMSPLQAIGRISPRPVFLIHGGTDPRMPLTEAQALLEAAQSPKDLWVIQGTEHLATYASAPDVYLARLVQFFNSSLRTSR
ncbi:MAG: alpha/beta hydrolase [Candidatus Omnitrophica bacterium]|nr:alpha/beta hydrolase [Candidatus Omnitrophota bacterium]